MSNIITTINFLREKPEERFLSIVNQSNNAIVGTKYVYLKDIPQEDLKNYIKFNLGEIKEPTRVWIEVREKQGTTSAKKNSFPLEVLPEYRQMPQEQTQNQQINQPQQTFAPSTTYLGNPIDLLGNPHMLGTIIEPHIKAARLVDREKDLEEAKETIRDLKKKNDILEIDLRKALTDLSTAEAKKDMAVMIAESKTKGFLDSDGFQKLLEKAPDMIEKMAALKHGQGEQVQQLGNPDWSDVKKEFLTVLDYLNDDQVRLLGGICYKMNDSNFSAQINQLLKQEAHA